MARSRSSNRPTGKLRRTVWLSRGSGVFNATATNDVLTTYDLVGEDVLEKYTNPTIVRIRGTLWVGIAADNSPLTTQEATDLYMGIIPVRGDEVWNDSLGAADGQESPFMWMGFRALGLAMVGYSTFTSAGALTTNFERAKHEDGSSNHHFEINAKAQRIIKANQKLALVVHPISRAGTPNVNIRGNLRVLIKE